MADVVVKAITDNDQKEGSRIAYVNVFGTYKSIDGKTVSTIAKLNTLYSEKFSIDPIGVLILDS